MKELIKIKKNTKISCLFPQCPAVVMSYKEIVSPYPILVGTSYKLWSRIPTRTLLLTQSVDEWRVM